MIHNCLHVVPNWVQMYKKLSFLMGINLSTVLHYSYIWISLSADLGIYVWGGDRLVGGLGVSPRKFLISDRQRRNLEQYKVRSMQQ